MGEVYRARDTRLDRTVAIKILPSHLSENSEAKHRFDREARTISSLNHPNICTLHDVGHQDGIDYLVMEFIEGETLADRLRRGALPVEQVLKYGIEICEGLEKAHRSGVVHRDLKPGNIMLTKAGAKLMDFGLAKAVITSPTSSLTATLSTPQESHPLTAQGAVIGTFQYMAPEQVEGQEADARSDIFALGAVLYEMATGKRAFAGKSAASAMAAVLERDPPPISSIQPATPPALERLVKTCLDKDPDERWQTAHDVKLQLRQIERGSHDVSSASIPLIAAQPGKRRYLPWAALTLSIVAAVAIGYFVRKPPATPTLWGGLNLAGTLGEEGSFVLSPDGSKLAYVGSDPQGRVLLSVRKLDSPKGLALDGTDGIEYPFWSADSRNLGFFADGKLKRIDADGQNLQVLCEAQNGRGGTWNRDGVIVFAPNAVGGLSKVNAAGGTPVAITHGDNVVSQRFPRFLPDGRHFLFTLGFSKDKDGTYVGSLDSPEIQRVIAGGASDAMYASGFVLLVRDGKLFAQPFDAKALRTAGEPFLVSAGIRWAFDRRTADFSAADNGVLVFLSDIGSGQRLVWFDREGKEQGVAVQDIGNPTSGLLAGMLSPDGERVAVTRAGGTGSNIWIYNLKTALGTRLTFGDDYDESPVWSPDGKEIVFTRNLLEHYEMRLKSVSGAGEEQVLVKNPGNIIPSSWSHDHRYLFYSADVFATSGKVQGMALAMNSAERQSIKATESTGDTFLGAFSPDDKWLAYVSDETGRFEVYATTFPSHVGKWQLSTGGLDNALGPIWVGKGPETEVIFRDQQSRLISVPVRVEGNSLSQGAPHVLLSGRTLASSRFIDVTGDGKRILLGLPQENASTPLTLLLNWTQNLRR